MKKILVRAPQWLGDAVVSTIFLSRLKHKFPDAEIHVLAKSSLLPLFASHAAVSAVIPFSYEGGQTVWEVARSLKAQSFEAVYILPRSLRTTLEAWLARIPRRIGFGGDLRRLLLTDVIPYLTQAFYAHRYLRLIDEDKLPIENIRPHFPASAPPCSTAEWPRPFIGFAPASVAPARTWPLERFVELGQELLAARGGTIVLFGSQNESPVTAAIKAKISGSVVDTAGQLDLAQLGGLMRQMDALVANDSGLMHVASAFNIPSVILFGPSDPRFALPPSGRCIALQDTNIFCVPCLRNHCVRLGDHHLACLRALSVAKVRHSLDKLMT